MALTETRPETTGSSDTGPGRPEPGPLEQLIGTGDHVSTGRLFIGFSLLFATLSLAGWAVYGIDVLTDNGFLGDQAAMLAPSSLVGLTLTGVVPLLLGIAFVVVPLQLGSPAIAFPRAAALSVWAWLVSAVIYVTSVVIDGGVGGADTDAAKLGNVSMGAMMVALGLGSVCVATTVMSHRPEGMGLARVPFLSWAFLVGSVLWIATLGSSVAHVIVGQVSRAEAPALAQNFADGIAWLLRGPTVFMFAIPVLGIAMDVVATRAGRRVTQYGLVQGIIGAYAVLAFGAWAQLPRSVNTALWTLFALAVAVPVLGLLGAVGDLLRRGRVKVDPALGLGVLAVLLLLGAVTSGLVWALDLAGTDTLFGLNTAALAQAQAAFVLTSALAGGAAALFHWSPQIWGARPARGRAGGAGGLVVLGGAVLATGLLVQGLVQLDGENTAAQFFGAVVALGALLMLLGVLGVLAASLGAAKVAAESDADADEDAVDGLTLEWAVPTPAVGGAVPDELPPVASPYPLLDAREGTDAKEDS
jgi:cytochrome c oxidase subunit 1